jgi:hypothetical protein
MYDKDCNYFIQLGSTLEFVKAKALKEPLTILYECFLSRRNNYPFF